MSTVRRSSCGGASGTPPPRTGPLSHHAKRTAGGQFFCYHICFRRSLRMSSPKKGSTRYSPSKRDCTWGE